MGGGALKHFKDKMGGGAPKTFENIVAPDVRAGQPCVTSTPAPSQLTAAEHRSPSLSTIKPKKDSESSGEYQTPSDSPDQFVDAISDLQEASNDAVNTSHDTSKWIEGRLSQLQDKSEWLRAAKDNKDLISTTNTRGPSDICREGVRSKFENVQSMSCSTDPVQSGDVDIPTPQPNPESGIAAKVSSLATMLTKVKAGDTHFFTLVDYSRRHSVFWLHLNGQRQPLIQKLIFEEYKDAMFLSEEDLDQLQVGDRVVARWSEDLELYRGRIEQKFKKHQNFKKTKIVVRFTDFGNSDVVELTSIFKYKPAFNDIPHQALSCTVDERNYKKILLKTLKVGGVVQCKIESITTDMHCKISLPNSSKVEEETTEYMDLGDSRETSGSIGDLDACSSARSLNANIYDWFDKFTASPENPSPPPSIVGTPEPGLQVEVFNCSDDDIQDNRDISPQTAAVPREDRAEAKRELKKSSPRARLRNAPKKSSNHTIQKPPQEDIFYSSEEELQPKIKAAIALNQESQLSLSDTDISSILPENDIFYSSDEDKAKMIAKADCARDKNIVADVSKLSLKDRRPKGEKVQAAPQRLEDTNMINYNHKPEDTKLTPTSRRRKIRRWQDRRTKKKLPPVLVTRSPVIIHPMYPQNLEVELQVLNVIDPSDFYCLDINADIEQVFLPLLDELRNVFESKPRPAEAKYMVSGSVWFIARQEPRRVRILQPGPVITVQEIDHGGFVDNVQAEELFWLPPGRCCTVPGFSFRCHLGGIKPSRGNSVYSADCTQFFKDNYLDSIVKGQIEDFDESKSSFELHLSSEDGTAINRLLVDLRYAESLTPPPPSADSVGEYQPSFTSEDGRLSVSIEDDWKPMDVDFRSPFNNYSTADDDLDVAFAGHKVSKAQCPKLLLFGHCTKGDFCPHSHNQLPHGAIVDEQISVPFFDDRSLVKNGLYSVQVADVCTLSNFTLVVDRHVGYEGTLFREEMAKNIQETATRINMNLELEIGKIVAVNYPSLGWVRGKIVDDGEEFLTDVDRVGLYLVDYGWSASFKISDLRNVSNYVAMLPYFAVPCTLNNIIPVDGKEERAIEQLRALKDIDCVQAQFVGVADGYNSVVVFYRVANDWHSIGAILCKNGLAQKRLS